MRVEGRIERTIAGLVFPAQAGATFEKRPRSQLDHEQARRVLDIAFALLLLVPALPIVFLAALLIALSTRSNPLLIQRRVGRHGSLFPMLKLRTMRGVGPSPTPDAKRPDDPRVTAVGRVLRRTSIDELPQLVNVLLGQMSLVGPRPALPEEVALYPPSWRRRLEVTPGLTGLWQVSGRSALSQRRWMALDRCYLRRRSLSFDAAILLRTIVAVVTMRGAW